jgi:YD repeat-containing protein
MIGLRKNKRMKTEEGSAAILVKQNAFKKIVLYIVLLGTAMIPSCQNDDPAPAAPVTQPLPTAKCKVQTQSVSGTTASYTYDFLFTYTYDKNGNQTAQTGTYKYKYSDGKLETSSNSTSNQFDANDYIIRRVTQASSTSKDGAVSNYSTNIEFAYADDRLIKQDYNTVENGKPKNFSYSYEYNTEGKVTKVSNTYDNSYNKYEWNGNKVQKMTRVDQYGNTTSPFLEYDNAGRLIKSIETSGGSSDEFRYQYDADGQLVRYERYINSKPSSAFTSEYDNKESPSRQMYPKLKGDPNIPRIQADYELKNNVTKEVSYNGDVGTGEWKVNSTTLYTYDYNNKNLPTEVIGQRLDDKGIQTTTNRTSYVYQDCL